jgi:hypothetical protein
MTALIYILEEKQVCIAMDTLSLNSDDGKPLLFTSKIFPLPHLGGLICGTGIMNFIANWMAYVQTNIVAKDIEHLGIHTPDSIRILWKKFHFTEKQTSTIYYFGYSKTGRRFKGYAFRSTNRFELEELQYSVGIKPPVPNMELKEIPVDIIRIMCCQKEQDDLLPLGQRLGIGGEIHFAVLTTSQLNMHVVHRFDDYDTCYRQMCEKLSQA